MLQNCRISSHAVVIPGVVGASNSGKAILPLRNPLNPGDLTMTSYFSAFSRYTLWIALAVACSLGTWTAEAQARSRQTTVTGSGGQTATRDVLRQNGDVSSSTTGPNGKSSSRVVDRSASGTTATLVGPNGKSASRVTTRTAGVSQSAVSR
jgi:hypothetical protein